MKTKELFFDLESHLRDKVVQDQLWVNTVLYIRGDRMPIEPSPEALANRLKAIDKELCMLKNKGKICSTQK